MLRARCFHLICTPSRCINLVDGIRARRQNLVAPCAESNNEPYFVWEPVPDSCGPDELENVFDALKYVDVVSPNHQELAALFRTRKQSSATILDSSMKAQCTELLTKGFGSKEAAVVVRCGARGCFIATTAGNTTMPAYYQPDQASDRVVDPTGAGNAFLGGFCVGLLEKDKPEGTIFETAAVYGSVAASFAVEQVGLPKLTLHQDGGQDGGELWNGESVAERLRQYQARLRS